MNFDYILSFSSNKIEVHENLFCSQRLRSLSASLPDAEAEERHAHISRLEESFTIHLGGSFIT